MKTNLLISIAALAGMTGSVMAAPVLYRDFQTDTVGQLPLPNAGDLLYPAVPADNSLQVVGGTDDPFGGGANQSLRWKVQTAGVGGAYYVMSGSSGSAPTNGRFSTKFFHTDTGDTGAPVTLIRLGQFSTWGAGNEAILLGIDGGNAIVLNDIYTPGAKISIDPQYKVSYSAVHDIAIDFNTDTDKFSLTLDGILLTADNGATSEFPFWHNMNSGIYAVEVVSPSSSRSGQVFIDNVTIDAIPEPASILSIAAFGGYAAMRRRRVMA